MTKIEKLLAIQEYDTKKRTAGMQVIIKINELIDAVNELQDRNDGEWKKFPSGELL